MERDFFDYVTETLNCVKGGSKEACLKVREFIQNANLDEDGKIIVSKHSAVNGEEFLEAVRVLMAFAWQNKEQDMVPERFICDHDCSRLTQDIFCPGECQVISKEALNKNETSKVKAKKCPYFQDSWDI